MVRTLALSALIAMTALATGCMPSGDNAAEAASRVGAGPSGRAPASARVHAGLVVEIAELRRNEHGVREYWVPGGTEPIRTQPTIALAATLSAAERATLQQQLVGPGPLLATGTFDLTAWRFEIDNLYATTP